MHKYQRSEKIYILICLIAELFIHGVLFWHLNSSVFYLCFIAILIVTSISSNIILTSKKYYVHQICFLIQDFVVTLTSVSVNERTVIFIESTDFILLRFCLYLSLKTLLYHDLEFHTPNTVWTEFFIFFINTCSISLLQVIIIKKSLLDVELSELNFINFVKNLVILTLALTMQYGMRSNYDLRKNMKRRKVTSSNSKERYDLSGSNKSKTHNIRCIKSENRISSRACSALSVSNSPLLKTLRDIKLLQDILDSKESEERYPNKFKGEMNFAVDLLEKVKKSLMDIEELYTNETSTEMNLYNIRKEKSVSLDPASREWLLQNSTSWNYQRKLTRKNRLPSLTRIENVDKLQKNNSKDTRKSSFSFINSKIIWNEKNNSGLVYLKNVSDWDKFDNFSFCKSCSDPLPLIVHHLMKTYRISERIPIKIENLIAFIEYVGQHYCGTKEKYLHLNDNSLRKTRNNYIPYHNVEHAVDVVQAVHALITANQYFIRLGSSDTLALIVAAAIHDYSHPGWSSSFLIDISHPIALQHNDQNPLERHHLAEAFKLMRKTEYDFMSGMKLKRRLEIRQTIIDLVLATDLSDSTKYISKFHIFLQNIADSEQETYKEKFIKTNNKSESLSINQEEVLLPMQIILKVADISHPCRVNEIHLEWTRRIIAEFHEQGKEQEALDMPVDYLCRKDTNINNSQLGFIDYIVRPIIVPFAKFIDMEILLTNLEANYQFWVDRKNSGNNKMI